MKGGSKGWVKGMIGKEGRARRKEGITGRKDRRMRQRKK